MHRGLAHAITLRENSDGRIAVFVEQIARPPKL